VDDVPSARRHSVAGAQDGEVDDRVAGNQVVDAQEVDGREVVFLVVDGQDNAPGAVRREVVDQAVVLFPAIVLVGHLRPVVSAPAVSAPAVFVLLVVYLLQAIELAAHPRPEVVDRADDHRVDFPGLVEFQRKGGDFAENHALRHLPVAFRVGKQAVMLVY